MPTSNTPKRNTQASKVIYSIFIALLFMASICGSFYYGRISTKTENAKSNNLTDTRDNSEVLGSAATAVTYPSDLSAIDLSYWYLTLPTPLTNPPIHGSPDNIYNLKNYSNPPWFNLNSTNDGIVFRAPTGGATTSGSFNPRSELREMADPTNRSSATCSNSKAPAGAACWSTSDGKYHSMLIEQAVTALPTKKPHIVVGQIHDGVSDVIVFRLEGTKLFIQSHPTTTKGPALNTPLTDTYNFGDKFSVLLEVQGNTTSAYYNGVLKYTMNRPITLAYFKAGAYTQSSCDPKAPLYQGDICTTYGENVIYSLKVCHADNPTICGNKPVGEKTLKVTVTPTTASHGSKIVLKAQYSDGTSIPKTGYTYSWDFGDATAVSTSSKPSHKFSKAGTYVVKLTLKNTSTETTTVGTINIIIN